MKRVSEFRASWVRVVVMAAAAVALSAGTAQAAPILLETITHDYGTIPGVSTPSLGSDSCDSLGDNSITIYDTSGGCGRFYDVFDFSSLEFESISSFQLTLTYSNTDDVNYLLGFIPVNEAWQVRPAASTSVGSLNNPLPALVRDSDTQTSTFPFDSSLDVFAAIVSNRQFYLWFAENAWGANNFQLYSASLAIYGEPKPAENVPDGGSSMLLMGLGFSLVAGASRRLRARRS